ncbi:MAG TPA: hypothetical protein VES79_03025 [Solirubrobacteraceae bacterium]|nr:hypothetical protein [Solirubrobacteraceae bacterium]
MSRASALKIPHAVALRPAARLVASLPSPGAAQAAALTCGTAALRGSFGQAAAFRFRTRVRHAAADPTLSRTFTLPQRVDIG